MAKSKQLAIVVNLGLIGIDGSPLHHNQVEWARLLVNKLVYDDNCKQRHGEDQERFQRSCSRSCPRLIAVGPSV